MPILVAGLTGNIASGKSAVRRLLAGLGAVTLDSDALVRDLYAPGAAGAVAVVREFGPGMLAPDGSVDRARLAARTMGDPGATSTLEGLVHPLVRTEVERWIAEQRREAAASESSGPGILVVEAALTYEAKTESRHDVMIVVDAPRDLRRSRAVSRGLTPEEFDRREGRMISPEEKRRRANYIVENGGDEAELSRNVSRLWEELTLLRRRTTRG